MAEGRGGGGVGGGGVKAACCWSNCVCFGLTAAGPLRLTSYRRQQLLELHTKPPPGSAAFAVPAARGIDTAPLDHSWQDTTSLAAVSLVPTYSPASSGPSVPWLWVSAC